MTKSTTPNTSHQRAKRNGQQTSDLAIEQRPLAQNETGNEEKLPLSHEDMVHLFLMTDLKYWTFKLNDNADQDNTYSAYDAPVDIWIDVMSEYADLDPNTDWADLMERADFMTQLWTFCMENNFAFPFQEISSQQEQIV